MLAFLVTQVSAELVSCESEGKCLEVGQCGGQWPSRRLQGVHNGKYHEDEDC